MTTIQALFFLMLHGAASNREPAAPVSVLTPEARMHNARAMGAYIKGDLDGALVELAAAYAAMPDPVGQRQGRDLVLASQRSALRALYARSGERRHLCAARALQLAHTAALLTALGPAAAPEDVASEREALREVDASLARDDVAGTCEPRPEMSPGTGERGVSGSSGAAGRGVPLSSGTGDPGPTRGRAERVTSSPARGEGPATGGVQPFADERGRRRRRGIAVGLLGAAAAPLLGTVVAAAVYADRHGRIIGLQREVDAAGRSPSVDEVMQVRDLQHEGRAARVAAIATGGVGGVLLLAGVGLLASDRQPRRRVGLAPRVGPVTYGLWLEGRF